MLADAGKSRLGDFQRDERAVSDESRPRPAACRALILAFSQRGLAGLRPWERGRPARIAALARGRALILASPIKGLQGQVSYQNQDFQDSSGARVFDGQALIRIRLGWISSYGEKRRLGEVKS